MRFGSVCSGIEAASVAWHDLGWSAAWFAELDAAPSAVLSSHYPHTPNLGDMTAIATRVLMGDVEAPDLLVGGTPCQAFSVAGLRNSLDDQRGQLSLEFIRLANALKKPESSAVNPPPSSSGKTSPVFYPPKTTPLAALLAHYAAKPKHCNRQGQGGRVQVLCLVPSEQSRGESWMPNISEWPNAASVCLLSQVIKMQHVPPKYFLSGTASAGILNRAERRGKALPTLLLNALNSVVNQARHAHTPLAVVAMPTSNPPKLAQPSPPAAVQQAEAVKALSPHSTRDTSPTPTTDPKLIPSHHAPL